MDSGTAKGLGHIAPLPAFTAHMPTLLPARINALFLLGKEVFDLAQHRLVPELPTLRFLPTDVSIPPCAPLPEFTARAGHKCFARIATAIAALPQYLQEITARLPRVLAVCTSQINKAAFTRDVELLWKAVLREERQCIKARSPVPLLDACRKVWDAKRQYDMRHFTEAIQKYATIPRTEQQELLAVLGREAIAERVWERMVELAQGDFPTFAIMRTVCTDFLKKHPDDRDILLIALHDFGGLSKKDVSALLPPALSREDSDGNDTYEHVRFF